VEAVEVAVLLALTLAQAVMVAQDLQEFFHGDVNDK
jgi:hypothetical protein